MATPAQNLIKKASDNFYSNGGKVPNYQAPAVNNAAPIQGLGLNPYPAPAPAPVAVNENTGGGGNTGRGSTYDPYAAQRAAEAKKAAEDEVTRQNLRSNVNGIIGGLTGIYDQLYGAINSGVGEAGIRLQDRYAKETGALGETFNQELPKIGLGYAARGLYDSSYRQQGEADATKGYNDQVTNLGDQLNLDKAAIGAEAMKQRASLQAEQGGINAIRARLNEVTDINELNQLRNEMEAKSRELEGKKATFASEGAQRQAYEAVANTRDRSGQLVSTLQTLVKGNAPRPLKIQTAQTIIANSGLSEDEKKKLNEQVVAVV